MTATPETASSGIRSLIPARIDRLPWSRFHTRMVVALGVARLLLTWPLVALCVAVAWPLVRSALPPGHPGPRHPSEPDIPPA